MWLQFLYFCNSIISIIVLCIFMCVVLIFCFVVFGCLCIPPNVHLMQLLILNICLYFSVIQCILHFKLCDCCANVSTFRILVDLKLFYRILYHLREFSFASL